MAPSSVDALMLSVVPDMPWLIGYDAMPTTSWVSGGSVTGTLRASKEPHEVERLQAAASGVDRIAKALQSGEIPLIGKTEAEVSAELGRRIIAEGHAVVNFAIVAAGENASSPHSTEDGPMPLNTVSHDLAIVEA